MAEASAAPRGIGLDRLASFRVIYLSVLAFMILYIVSVEAAETLLDSHFREGVRTATRVSPSDGPIVSQIQNRVSDLVQNSVWTSFGGVRVNVTVLGADSQTPLYVGGGRVLPPPPAANLDAAMHEALRLLPAIPDVFVSVPHGSVFSTSIFIAYGAILLQSLFVYNRRLARRGQVIYEAAVTARNLAATRARSIEEELANVRERLQKVEPAEEGHASEIRMLQYEREELRRKLRGLGERESELRANASRTTELEEERQALESLLDEAIEDVGSKEAEISSLQDRLKRASRGDGSGGKSREDERLMRRMRTLYKNLEVTERAIDDLVALRDDAMKLRAEEGIKRLDEDSDSAAIRRKVGGLPPHLSIFELGFAGKGRLYYTRTDNGRFRVLAVGAKNSQKQDLEYLSRLS